MAVQNSMMASQPSPDLQSSLGLWRCFVVDLKGLDELQLLLVEPRSQPPVPPVGLPSLNGWPCLPPSSLVMPLNVTLYGKQEVVQGSLFWKTQLLVVGYWGSWGWFWDTWAAFGQKTPPQPQQQNQRPQNQRQKAQAQSRAPSPTQEEETYEVLLAASNGLIPSSLLEQVRSSLPKPEKPLTDG